MAELDVAGTERQAFVTITVFDEHGWAAEEDMWWSGHSDSLAEHLGGLTGMSPAEADALVGDFLQTWERRGGRAEGAAVVHRFSYGVLGIVLAVAGVSSLVTWSVRPLVRGRRTTSR